MMVTGADALEKVLFAVFVVAADGLVAINMGGVLFAGSWDSLLVVLPILSLATLVSFLAFVLLEDYSGRGGRRTDEIWA